MEKKELRKLIGLPADPEPEPDDETKKINKARAVMGLPPIKEEKKEGK